MVALALCAQALQELTQLDTLQYNVILLEQDLFYPTVEAHIAAHPSTTGIRNWLSTHHLTVVSSMKEVIRRALQGVQSIATYFPRHTTLTSPAEHSGTTPPRVPPAPPGEMPLASPNTD
jgi:hypothetical protein